MKTDLNSYGAQLAWEGVLDEIEDYLEQREDIRDGGDGKPLPNEEMRLLSDLRLWRPKTKAKAPVQPGNTPTERKPSAEASGKPGTEARQESPLLEELDAITEGKSKLDLAEEIWRLRKQVEDERLSAALHENAAGQLAQMAADYVSPGPNYLSLIQDHNRQCQEACDWRAKHPGYCAYRKQDGGFIYGENRDCHDCPRDWLIDIPSATDRQESK